MKEAIEYYLNDHNTQLIVLIGEIGGDEEEKSADFLNSYINKPVVAYIAGKSAPQGKRMGHAGAIISGDIGTAQGKINALKNAGVSIANNPWNIPKIINEIL